MKKVGIIEKVKITNNSFLGYGGWKVISEMQEALCTRAWVRQKWKKYVSPQSVYLQHYTVPTLET